MDPIKYADQAVQLRTDTDALVVMNDSLKTDIHLFIWPRYLKPNREIIISIFLEYGAAQQFVMRDTTRYHPDMVIEKTDKTISLNTPMEIRVSPGHGRLTYSLKYLNPKNGAYREAYAPYGQLGSPSYSRRMINKVFADSTSYLQEKSSKAPIP
ncbi:MAG: hypothetical protein Roseis2KO_44610 [Roseivirga sp.]